MRHAPPLRQIASYPVTGTIVVLSVAMTVAWWVRPALGQWLLMPARLDPSQLWRLLSATLLHADILHLLFNLYWIWSFGTLIERIYRWWALALTCVMLALGSSAAQFAVSDGGVGLSGVVYGLFGLLWVLGRRQPRFAIVDGGTVQLFAGWFVFCIVLTKLDVWRVGNMAHGSGAVLGLCLGYAIVGRGWARPAGAIALALAVAAALTAATIFRPIINPDPAAPLPPQTPDEAIQPDADSPQSRTAPAATPIAPESASPPGPAHTPDHP